MITCPSCGAETQLPSGERLVSCAFCGSSLYVDRGDAVSRYRLPRLLDAAQARAALARWMAGNETVKDLDRKSRVSELVPVAFPVWMFRSDAGGGRVFVEPAAPTPIPEIADLEVPAGELVADREGEASEETVEPTIPAATARGWLEGRGVESFSETALVRLPLWRARYVFAGREYQALVDGSTGRVLATVFPEKAESPFFLVAILGLIVFGVLGLAISHPLTKLVAFAVAAVPLWLLAFWVARRV